MREQSMAKARSVSMNTALNVLTSICVLCANLIISFFLSPYIVRTIGVEANGFVTLANNFVNYANLIVTALNAMAARFITIAYVNNDHKKANFLYNSVFWGNLIIVAVLLFPAAIIVVRLENFVDVPSNILLDVKILFLFIFLAFFIRTGAPNYDCGTYVTNRMDLSNVSSMAIALLRCVVLFCMFYILEPHVYYVGIAAVLVSVATLIVMGYYTKRLTPELRIMFRPAICSFNMIKVLVESGIWNSIATTGNTLLNGLDLLICNSYLGSTLMGVLSLSKTLPNILIMLSESIRGSFGPELTINYANGDRDGVLKCICKAMKITSVIVTIPTAGLVVIGDAFYSLWVPSQDAKLLWTLTVLAILSYLVNSGVVILFNVFTTVNRVKYNSAAMLVSGFASVVITVLIIEFTDYDLYAVAGVSSVITIFKNLFFTIPVASRLLGYKWYQFYPQVGVSVLSSGLIIAVGIVVRLIIPVDTWASFFGACFIIGAIGLAINMIIVLNKEERLYLVGIVKCELKR